jgi:hypothetical protein
MAIIVRDIETAKNEIFAEYNKCMGGIIENPTDSDIEAHFNDMDNKVLEYACKHERATFEYIGTEHDGDIEMLVFGNVDVHNPYNSLRVVYALGQKENAKVELVLWRGSSFPPVLLTYFLAPADGNLHDAIDRLYEKAWAVEEALNKMC